MTDAQGYVAILSELLGEYGADPAKCELIAERDNRDSEGLLPLLMEWYAADHPDWVTRTVERGTIESAECLDVVCKIRCGPTDTPPSG